MINANKRKLSKITAILLTISLIFRGGIEVKASDSNNSKSTDRIVNAIENHTEKINTLNTTLNTKLAEINQTINTGLNTIANAISNIQINSSGTSSGGDVIKPSVMVTALDAGTVTVTDGVHTYKKELEEPGNATFPNIQSLGDFTVTLTDNGQTFTKNITITDTVVYRVIIGFPTLIVNSENANKITVSNGQHTYSQDVNGDEDVTFRLESFGEYKVLIESDNSNECGETTVNISDYESYTAEIFTATVTINCMLTSGTGILTATSADGKYVYQTPCTAGDTDIIIHTRGKYRFAIEQNETTGEITTTKEINNENGTYNTYAGFADCIADDYSNIEWEKISASSSHISVKSLSTTYKNIIEVNGSGLLLGAYNHTWLNYVTQNGTVQFEILIDGVVWDQFTVPRNCYDHTAGWGYPINNKIVVPREYTATSSRSRSTSGNQNIYTGVMTNIGKCVQFNQSLVVRARYQNTPDSSDSIYYFDVAILRTDQ